MTDHDIRLFENDAAIVHVGDGLIHRTLPRAEWTHEAHLAACLQIVRPSGYRARTRPAGYHPPLQ